MQDNVYNVMKVIAPLCNTHTHIEDIIILLYIYTDILIHSEGAVCAVSV